MTPSELEARNLSHDEMVELLCRLENASYIPSITITREILRRMTIAERMASLLDDSLFYARMYQDQCPEGKKRREEMIDDATSMIREFRTGKP